MKQLKIALLGIISTLLLFVVLIPIKAEAASIIKSGKTIALKDKGDAPLYKITLEEDSVIKVEWANNKQNFSTFCIYADSKTQNELVFSWLDKGVSGKEFFALKKGVYYIRMYDQASGGPTTRVTVSWTPVSTFDQGNYCADKAVNLSFNKTMQLVQTPGNNCERYYKFKITKAPKSINLMITYQIVYIIPDKAPIYFHIYNEDFSREYSQSDVLPVGTYYLVADPIPRPYFWNSLGTYITFKLK